jgi:hypothetical protein
VPEELVWYYRAYHHLRTEAQLGAFGGRGDIPWLKVEEYLDRRGVTSAWVRDFTHDLVDHLHVVASIESAAALKSDRN